MISRIFPLCQRNVQPQTELDRITGILDHRNELILNEIRVTIKSKQDEVEISNREVEFFLMEQ